MGGTIQLRAETHDGQDNPGDRGLYTYESRSGGSCPSDLWPPNGGGLVFLFVEEEVFLTWVVGPDIFDRFV